MVDVDRAKVVSELRSTQRASGLSQASFARAMGTSASRLSTYLTGGTVPSAAWFLRAIRVGRALTVAKQRSWLTPVDAADGMRRALSEGDPVWALRVALQCRDDLVSVLDHREDDHDLSAAWEAAPESVGVEQWDRLLASVIGHEFEIRGLVAPAWTSMPNSKQAGMEQGSVFSSPFFTDEEVRSATPAWLADRGLFIAARDLVTV